MKKRGCRLFYNRLLVRRMGRKIKQDGVGEGDST